MHDNQLSGNLPSFGCGTDTDSNCGLRITEIDVSDNRFTGDGIPGIGRMCRLTTLIANDNHFTGVGNLPASVRTVDFDRNSIASAAESLGFSDAHCKLSRLQMEQNQITGGESVLTLTTFSSTDRVSA